MGKYMKATKGGTLCAMGKVNLSPNNPKFNGEGIAVGPYYSNNDKTAINVYGGSGYYFMTGMEYDSSLNRNKVVIYANNCIEHKVPVHIRLKDKARTTDIPFSLDGCFYIVTEVADRDISTTKCYSLEEAQELMFRRYVCVVGRESFEKSKYSDKHFHECLDEISHDPEFYEEGTAMIFARSAYANDAVNHANYDWKIDKIHTYY